MKIYYLPDIGCQINSGEIKWGDSRESVRSTLLNAHKEDDRIIDLSIAYGGDTSFNIHQKRDIYKDFNGAENYFFCNYNKDNCLSEVEFHSGVDISVSGVTLTFAKDISLFLTEFKKLGYHPTEIEDEKYFFEGLKMVIATSGAMGGEGRGLDYFYAGKDVSHLIE
jgi:hypothetical protein